MERRYQQSRPILFLDVSALSYMLVHHKNLIRMRYELCATMHCPTSGPDMSESIWRIADA